LQQPIILCNVCAVFLSHLQKLNNIKTIVKKYRQTDAQLRTI